VLTLIIIFIVFSSVVAILWVGSHDVLTGQISPGRLGQFVLYAAFAAAGLGQLSEVWGEVSAASGAAERLFEILRVKSQITAPASRCAAAPARGDVGFDRSLRLSTRPDMLASTTFRSVKASERSRSSARRGGKSTLFHCCASDPHAERFRSTVPVRSADPVDLRARIAGAPGLGGVRGFRPRKHPLRPA
jgi:ATP-binding cassette subfamily B protein